MLIKSEIPFTACNKTSSARFDYPAVADNAEQQIIIGGLVWGKNDLKLRIKPLPASEGGERVLEVNALIINGTKEKPEVRVFSWETKSATPPEEIELPVWVSSATLRGL